MPYTRDDLEAAFSAAMVAGGYGSPSLGALDHAAADSLLLARPADCQAQVVGAVQNWSMLSALMERRRECQYAPAKPSLPMISKFRDFIRYALLVPRGLAT